jgi:WD40 repeat protein
VKRLILCLLFLAACAPPEANPLGDHDSVMPTVPPPPWVEPAETVSLENVSRIAYLGRLDTTGTPSTVFAYAVSPDATRLAGLNNDQLLAWDLVSGTLLFGTSRAEAIQVYYSPDKTEIYTIDTEGLVNVYETEQGIITNNFSGHPQYNGVAAFYGDDGWLAMGGLSGEVKVWDPLERASLVTFQAQQLQVTALAFSQDGNWLASAGDDSTVTVWDWRNRQAVATFNNEDVSASRLAFSPDGSQLAVGTEDTVRLWSIADGTLIQTLNTGSGGITDVLTYSPDGQYLINGGAIPQLTLWDPQTGEQVAQLPDVGGDRTSASFSPDGTILATSVLGGTVTLWNMTQITSATVNRADLPLDTRQILYVQWTSDSRLLTIFDALGPIYVWGVGPTEENQAGE